MPKDSFTRGPLKFQWSAFHAELCSPDRSKKSYQSATSPYDLPPHVCLRGAARTAWSPGWLVEARRMRLIVTRLEYDRSWGRTRWIFLRHKVAILPFSKVWMVQSIHKINECTARLIILHLDVGRLMTNKSRGLKFGHILLIMNLNSQKSSILE